MESLSIWSLVGVVLNSAVIMAVRLSTQRVWHTFNYDVTVSNGVNLCRPVNVHTCLYACGHNTVNFKYAFKYFPKNERPRTVCAGLLPECSVDTVAETAQV